MADVLKHLETVRGSFQTDSWWHPRSYLESRMDGAHPQVDYLERYRLKLVSQVGYAVNRTDENAFSSAHRIARKQLVRHLYGKQLDLAHDALHAVYSGDNREKVAEKIQELIESMMER